MAGLGPSSSQLGVVGFLAQKAVDADELGEFLGLFERDVNLLAGKRFDQIIKRAVFHAVHGGFNGAEPGDHHHQRFLRAELDGLQQVGAVAVRQPDIQEDQIEVVPVQILLRLGNGLDGGDVITPVAQLLFEVSADDGVVLQHNDFFDGHKSRVVAAVKVGNEMGWRSGA